MPLTTGVQPEISIHALRVEGDGMALGSRFTMRISIHALRVEGDVFCCGGIRRIEISIHALRVEGDALASGWTTSGTYFYPRPPGGGRPVALVPQAFTVRDFYPRPPGGGRLW